MSGTAKTQNSAAAKKLCCWTYDIALLGPTIEYKKGSNNIIADSLLRLRTNDYYTYDKPLHNGKPIHLQEKIEVKEINAVQTHAQTAERENNTTRLPELQVRVRDIFKTAYLTNICSMSLFLSCVLRHASVWFSHSFLSCSSVWSLASVCLAASIMRVSLSVAVNCSAVIVLFSCLHFW